MNTINPAFDFLRGYCPAPIAHRREVVTPPIPTPKGKGEDPQAVTERLRDEWEREVAYSQALTPDVIDDILSDVENNRPERARETMRTFMAHSFQCWRQRREAQDQLHAEGFTCAMK